MAIVTKEKRNLIKDTYLDNKNVALTSRICDCSYTTVKKVLVEFGIPYEKALFSQYRKYQLNKFFFDEINTEEKAYWLGFLMADGCISKKNGSLDLTLSDKDRGHIEKFLRSIGADHPIKPRVAKSPCSENWFLHAKVVISSRQMIQSLIKHNLTPKKSLALRPPENLQSYLVHHFIRGYFDGDGGFSRLNKGRDFSANFTSTYEMCDFIKNFFSNLNVNCYVGKRFKDNKNNYTIVFTGLYNVLKFGEILYKDSSIFLDRKQSIFEEIKLLYKERHPQNQYCIIFRRNKWVYYFSSGGKRYWMAFDLKEECLSACLKKMKETNYENLHKFIEINQIKDSSL